MMKGPVLRRGYSTLLPALGKASHVQQMLFVPTTTSARKTPEEISKSIALLLDDEETTTVTVPIQLTQSIKMRIGRVVGINRLGNSTSGSELKILLSPICQPVSIASQYAVPVDTHVVTAAITALSRPVLVHDDKHGGPIRVSATQRIGALVEFKKTPSSPVEVVDGHIKTSMNDLMISA